MGPAEVEAKTGVRPHQIVDWLSLVGDTVDNIPGVPGVGAKTAADLLRSYGSLDGIWAHMEEISRPRIRESLTQSRQAVERNVGLVRLDTAVAGLEDWRASTVREGDAGRLAEFFAKVEFESMARRIRQPDLFGGLL
jgi:DNA polymerase-1